MSRKKIYKDELCATCKLKRTCQERPEDIMVDLCSQYEETEKSCVLEKCNRGESCRLKCSPIGYHSDPADGTAYVYCQFDGRPCKDSPYLIWMKSSADTDYGKWLKKYVANKINKGK